MRISDWSSDVCSSDLVQQEQLDWTAGLPHRGADGDQQHLLARVAAAGAVEQIAEAAPACGARVGFAGGLLRRCRQGGQQGEGCAGGDRKSVGVGKRVAGREKGGGRRRGKKKKKK